MQGRVGESFMMCVGAEQTNGAVSFSCFQCGVWWSPTQIEGLTLSSESAGFGAVGSEKQCKAARQEELQRARFMRSPTGRCRAMLEAIVQWMRSVGRVGLDCWAILDDQEERNSR